MIPLYLFLPQSATIHSVLLHYTIHSKGKQTIVLLHGYLSSSLYWRPLIPSLAKHYQVVAIDLLGFGDSPKPAHARYTLDEHAAAVIHTLETIGCTHITLAGHSMGALVAARVARLVADTPLTARHLVLFNPPIFTDAHEAHDAFVRTSRLYRLMLYSSMGAIGWPVLRRMIHSPLIAFAPSPSRQLAKSLTDNTRISRRFSLQNTIEVTNGIALLTALSTPTTLINGLSDRPQYGKNLLAHATEMPPCVRVHWEDATHHFPIVAPDRALQYLLSPST